MGSRSGRSPIRRHFLGQQVLLVFGLLLGTIIVTTVIVPLVFWTPLGELVYNIGLLIFYAISLPALLLVGETALASTTVFYALVVVQCYFYAVAMVAVTTLLRTSLQRTHIG